MTIEKVGLTDYRTINKDVVKKTIMALDLLLKQHTDEKQPIDPRVHIDYAATILVALIDSGSHKQSPEERQANFRKILSNILVMGEVAMETGDYRKLLLAP